MRAFAVLATFATVTGALTACGEAGASRSQDDLVVGILAPLTGEFGSYGKDHVRAYKLAEDEINEAGGLPNGAKLKLVIEDEGSTAESAVSAATKLITADGAQAVIGPTSIAMVALDSTSKSYKVPIISSSAGTVRLDGMGGEWLFRTYPSDSAEGSATARFLQDQDLQSVSVLVQNAESPQGIVKVLTKEFQESGGTIVATTEFDGGQPSYQSQVESAIKTGADVVYVAAGEESGRTIMQEVRQAGYDGRVVLNGDLNSPNFLKATGADLMKDVCAPAPFGGDASPAFTRFDEAFKAVADGKESYTTVPNSYDALLLVALASIAADSVDGEDIRDKLREVAGAPGAKVDSYADAVQALDGGDDIDFDGASGILDFDDSGTSPSAFMITCVEGGKWVTKTTYEMGQ